MHATPSIYGDLNDNCHWFALYTRARHEKKVENRLKSKGVTCYLPLRTVFRRWSDRTKKVSEPLFSCYVFIFLMLRDRLNALQTDGVLGMVSFNGIPASIRPDQIDAVRRVLDRRPGIESAEYYTPGARVEVVSGPFRGLKGTLITIRNQSRLVISVDGIKQAFSVEIRPDDVKCI